MVNRFLVFFILGIFIFSCGKKKVDKSNQVSLEVKKVIIIDNGEFSMLYFKIKVINSVDKNYVFLNNPYRPMSTLKNGICGFYLKNIDDGSSALLYRGTEFYDIIKGGYSGFIFLGSDQFSDLEMYNSNLLKSKLSNYNLCYDGSMLDSVKHKQRVFAKYNGAVDLLDRKYYLDISPNIEIKYHEGIPVYEEEWNEL